MDEAAFTTTDSILKPLGTILSILISTLGGIGTYYYFFVVKKPKVYVNNKKMSNFLQNHIKILEQSYWPSFLYWEGRLQTILSLKKRLPSSTKIPYRREIFKLKDGGELALDYLGKDSNPSSGLHHSFNNDGDVPVGDDERHKLIVLVLPGLTSSSQTCYIKTLVMSIHKAGAMVVSFNNRGIGGIPLKTPRTHNFCNCDDIHEVITHLRNIYRTRKIMAIGTSMGGMLLCRYLITYPEESKNTFVAAFVISTVWDIWAATENMEIPYINKYIINYGICKDILYRVKKYQNILEKRDCWNFDKIYQSKSGKDFDTTFHVPQGGFKSIEEYYDKCLIVNQTSKFPIPVFAINAYDDPMMPGRKLPVDEIYKTTPESNLALIVTAHGGHLGFLEGNSAQPIHYIEKLTQQFVHAIKYYSDELSL